MNPLSYVPGSIPGDDEWFSASALSLIADGKTLYLANTGDETACLEWLCLKTDILLVYSDVSDVSSSL